MTTEEKAYKWNDEIQNDGSAYTLLTPGIYPFIVTKFERGRYEGGDKIPPCNKAQITIEVDGGEQGTSMVDKDFLLHSKIEGILCAFFKCIGMRKHGEPLRMDWPGTIGKRGYVKLKHREHNDKKYNEIAEWIDPEKAPRNGASAQPAPAQTEAWADQF